MRNIEFTIKAFAEYNDWLEKDKQLFYKVKDLIKEIAKEPFKGIGKPEPLKGNFTGFWSRRINQEHRIVYRVTNETF